jgi:hypothetical protein
MLRILSTGIKRKLIALPPEVSVSPLSPDAANSSAGQIGDEATSRHL